MEIVTINPKCLVFNGEDEIFIRREELEKYRPKKLVELFECTAVYRDLVNDFIENGSDSVVTIRGRRPTTAMLLQLERGFMLIYERMEEVFGPDSAAEIWSKTANSINLEKCE